MKIDYLSLEALGIGAIFVLLIFWRACRSREKSHRVRRAPARKPATATAAIGTPHHHDD